MKANIEQIEVAWDDVKIYIDSCLSIAVKERDNDEYCRLKKLHHPDYVNLVFSFLKDNELESTVEEIEECIDSMFDRIDRNEEIEIEGELEWEAQQQLEHDETMDCLFI